jgi:hypothetical protein
MFFVKQKTYQNVTMVGTHIHKYIYIYVCLYIDICHKCNLFVKYSCYICLEQLLLASITVNVREKVYGISVIMEIAYY